MTALFYEIELLLMKTGFIDFVDSKVCFFLKQLSYENFFSKNDFGVIVKGVFESNEYSAVFHSNRIFSIEKYYGNIS